MISSLSIFLRVERILPRPVWLHANEATKTEREEGIAKAGPGIKTLAVPLGAEGRPINLHITFFFLHFRVSHRKRNGIHGFLTRFLSPKMTFANNIRENIFSPLFLMSNI